MAAALNVFFSLKTSSVELEQSFKAHILLGDIIQWLWLFRMEEQNACFLVLYWEERMRKEGLASV